MTEDYWYHKLKLCHSHIKLKFMLVLSVGVGIHLQWMNVQNVVQTCQGEAEFEFINFDNFYLSQSSL